MIVYANTSPQGFSYEIRIGGYTSVRYIVEGREVFSILKRPGEDVEIISWVSDCLPLQSAILISRAMSAVAEMAQFLQEGIDPPLIVKARRDGEEVEA